MQTTYLYTYTDLATGDTAQHYAAVPADDMEYLAASANGHALTVTGETAYTRRASDLVQLSRAQNYLS